MLSGQLSDADSSSSSSSDDSSLSTEQADIAAVTFGDELFHDLSPDTASTGVTQ